MSAFADGTPGLGRPPKRNAGEIAEAVRKVVGGQTLAAVARELGVSSMTVSRWMTERGYALRWVKIL